MKRSTGVLLGIYCSVVALFLFLPVFIIVPMSFGTSRMLQFPPNGFTWAWYGNFFTSPPWRSAAWNSIQIAVLVAILATLLGTSAALAMERGRYFPRRLSSSLLLAPLVVPYVVIGVGMYALFLRIGLVGTRTGFIIAHTVLAVPFVVVNVAAVLKNVDSRLEQAGMSLGATPWRVFRSITLPLIAPGMLAGALFAFITSFDEVVVAIFLGGPFIETLPLKMWSAVRIQVDPTIAAASSLLIVVTTVVLVSGALVQYLARRRQGEL